MTERGRRPEQAAPEQLDSARQQVGKWRHIPREQPMTSLQLVDPEGYGVRQQERERELEQAPAAHIPGERQPYPERQRLIERPIQRPSRVRGPERQPDNGRNHPGSGKQEEAESELAALEEGAGQQPTRLHPLAQGPHRDAERSTVHDPALQVDKGAAGKEPADVRRENDAPGRNERDQKTRTNYPSKERGGGENADETSECIVHERGGGSREHHPRCQRERWLVLSSTRQRESFRVPWGHNRDLPLSLLRPPRGPNACPRKSGALYRRSRE